MKTTTKFLILTLSLLLAALSVMGQAGGERVGGLVVGADGAPIVGATVIVEGTAHGTSTDAEGRFAFTPPQGAKRLEISYLGYQSRMVELTHPLGELRVVLTPDAHSLEEVVVIGYGTTRKSDLTGAVSSLNEEDFNEGLIASPEGLVSGKIAGVQIIAGGGSPTSGSTIRIRGGASLNASNEPLVVIDGVPVEVGGSVSGGGNFMALLNPNDIASMTVLKDASSTAIYGSRASNGVILITTKRGKSQELKISLHSTLSLQSVSRLSDMLSVEEFVDVVEQKGSEAQKALLGTERTDWNGQIFGVASGTDNNLSIMGSIGRHIPFRSSLGYYDQNGTLRGDRSRRYTANISFSPSFFGDYLRMNISLKGAFTRNRFANQDAIWGGATHNPTIPIRSGEETFGGYYEAVDGAGVPVTGATGNPVGLLEQFDSTSRVHRLVANADVDYKFHPLPELRLHATLGYDYSQGAGEVYVPAEAFQYYTSGGRDYTYGPQHNHNRLLTTYLNYNKNFDGGLTIDATLGYDYQYWQYTNAEYVERNVAGEVYSSSSAADSRHVLISYYGRLNLSYEGRYLLTTTLRRDGTSRFSPQSRWGVFPSVALAWRLSEEEWMSNVEALSELKLRVSYGVTGQQDGIGNYAYLPVYTYGQTGAEYMFGGVPIHTYRPEAYVSDLKWETTKSLNAGVDISLYEERLSASVDLFTRRTSDLLAVVPAPAGTNFDKEILTNVGNVASRGVELTLNVTPIKRGNLRWDVSFNATRLVSTIENLTLVEGAESPNTPVGPTVDGQHVQVFTEGYAPYSFYVYKQIYDQTTGRPIEGLYADLDGDGKTTTGDLYRYHSPAPDWLMGLSSSLSWGRWSLSTTLRASLGNYIYNGMAMNTGAWNTMSYNSYQLNNLHRSYLFTRFESRQHLSDHYVENGSFLKMDNLTLGYNFGEVGMLGRVSAALMVQNVFTITSYTGVDPEVAGGMDMAFYPRPRTVSLSLGVEF